MNETTVTTSATFDDKQYHLHQLIEESIDDDVSSLFDDSDNELHWIVIGLDGGLKLVTTDLVESSDSTTDGQFSARTVNFSDETFIPSFRVDSDEYVPKYCSDGLPYWGY